MGKAKYYEATGDTKAKLAAMLQKRDAAIKAIRKWMKSHGGRMGYSDGWSFTAVLAMPDDKQPADPENWKRHHAGGNHWLPKHSTKIGKQRGAELERLCSNVLSGFDFGDAIKLPHFGGGGGLHMHTPGIAQKGNRILVTHTHPTWEPPKGVTLKRISDLQYEKFLKAS